MIVIKEKRICFMDKETDGTYVGRKIEDRIG